MGFKVTDLATPFFQIKGLESQTEGFVHKSTLFVLTFLSILLSAKPFFGESIVCQIPKDWPQSSTAYFHDVCYYGDRQPTVFMKTIERSGGRGIAHLNLHTGTADFYMWVPYILILQTMLTLLPALLWKFVGLGCFNGADLVALLEAYAADKKDKEELVADNWRQRKLAFQFHLWSSEKSNAVFGKSRTLLIYVVMKWFRLFLFIAQFCLIANLFEGGNLLWGIQAILKFWGGKLENPLTGEFTLLAGCSVHRMQMSTGIKPMTTRVNTVKTSCILASNFLYAKVFLFLYWWFLAGILFCLTTAIRFTAILLSAKYRRYCFQSLIPTQSHYITRYGQPHPDLNLGMKEPIDYLSDHVGNDGFLMIRFVFDTLHYHGIQVLTGQIWKLVVVQNGIHFEEQPEEENEKKKEPRSKKKGEDGGGDRHQGGKDEKGKPSSMSMIEEDQDEENGPSQTVGRTSSMGSLSTSSTAEAIDQPLLLPKI